MEVGKLTVSYREESGKGAARKLRAKGLVPGVCYGASVDGRIEPMPITLSVKELKGALDPVRRTNTVLDVTVTGGKQSKLTALVKEFEVDPIRREVMHVDLLVIDPNKEVVADVPLEFSGKHKGAIDGGQLRYVMRSVEVRAKPASIPVKLIIDVSPMGVGDVLHVYDIALPAGVTSVTGRDQAVVLCQKPEEEKGEAAAAAPAADAKAPTSKAAPASARKPSPAPVRKAAPAAKPAAKK